MTNYRRLISYIYAYEGEVKGKNIGFAKLESRNGQCKLSVNVKKVYVGSSDLGVYLLAPGKEIFLGSIFIRSGGGEFRAVVNVENAGDSGFSMDQCYGLTIHEQGDTWRAYTTIWEDAVAHAAEVELADVTSSRVGNPQDQLHRKVKELNQELRAGEIKEDSQAEGPEDGPVISSSPAAAREAAEEVTTEQPDQVEGEVEYDGLSPVLLHEDDLGQAQDTFADTEKTPECMGMAADGAESQYGSQAVTKAETETGKEERTETAAESGASSELEAVSEAAAELEMSSDGMDMTTEPYTVPVNSGWCDSERSDRLHQKPCRENSPRPWGFKDSERQVEKRRNCNVNGIMGGDSISTQNGSFRSGYGKRQPSSWDKAGPASIRRQLHRDNRFGIGMPADQRTMPEMMPEGMRETMPEMMPEMPPETMPEGMPEMMPEMMPETMPETMPEMMPETMPEMMPETMPETTSEMMPEVMPETTSETMPEMMPETMPEVMPEMMPETMSETMPEVMPDTAPETAPDTRVPLQPDNMPGTRAVPRTGIMTRPGMPRRQMPMGNRQPNPAMPSMRQEKPQNRQIQPPVWQPDLPQTQPIPDSKEETTNQIEEKEPVIDAGEEALILGDPRELERLEQEEQRNHLPQQLWDGFRKRYPKIQAFDSTNGCEILTIKPQDIGLLPRENWNYGNNSFLLHGYYNYRYLILARIGDDTKGRTRYILGVPGNYYSNEKYMASMFGFPHFVLAKKQPSQDGRFGYWYTDIRLENQD